MTVSKVGEALPQSMRIGSDVNGTEGREWIKREQGTWRNQESAGKNLHVLMRHFLSPNTCVVFELWMVEIMKEN